MAGVRRKIWQNFASMFKLIRTQVSRKQLRKQLPMKLNNKKIKPRLSNNPKDLTRQEIVSP